MLPSPAQRAEAHCEAQRLELLAESLRELADQLPPDFADILRTLGNACTHGAELVRVAHDGRGITMELMEALRDFGNIARVARRVELRAKALAAQPRAEEAPRGSR